MLHVLENSQLKWFFSTKRPNSDWLGGKNKVSEDDLADSLHISTMASD